MIEDREALPARTRQSCTVAAFVWDICSPTQCQPDVARVNAGVQRLFGRSIPQIDQHEIPAEYPAVYRAVFIGQGLTVLTQSHALAS